jgi:hypothetical protein
MKTENIMPWWFSLVYREDVKEVDGELWADYSLRPFGKFISFITGVGRKFQQTRK